MTKTVRWVAGLIAAVLLCGTSMANERWIHVRVDDLTGHGETVRISVPLRMLDAMLPTIETDDLHRGKIRVHDDDLDLEGIDLAAVLRELRTMEDTEFIKVKSRDEDLRVAKEGDMLIVRIEDRRDGDGTTKVTIPIAVAEAFVGDEGSDEVDLVAALDALDAYTGGELVRIESPDEFVRIWIDDGHSIDE
jgi:hypothetical protein